ncbi:hypothetical protein MMC10_001145 [Thelotrema lepadinum]|nr:hypothetical protein [Thelotrema lepadinum]
MDSPPSLDTDATVSLPKTPSQTHLSPLSIRPTLNPSNPSPSPLRLPPTEHAVPSSASSPLLPIQSPPPQLFAQPPPFPIHSTNPAAIQTAPNSNPANATTSFLSLPPDIRLQIYALLFPEGSLASIGYGPWPLGTSTHSSTGHVNLLYTCKTIYGEGRPVMFSNTVFKLVNSTHIVRRFLTETDEDVLGCVRVVEVVHLANLPLVLLRAKLEGERKRRVGRDSARGMGMGTGRVVRGIEWEEQWVRAEGSIVETDNEPWAGANSGYEEIVGLIGEKLHGLEVLSLTLPLLDISLPVQSARSSNWPPFKHSTKNATILPKPSPTSYTPIHQHKSYPHIKLWGAPLYALAQKVQASYTYTYNTSPLPLASHGTGSGNGGMDRDMAAERKRTILPNLAALVVGIQPRFADSCSNHGEGVLVLPDRDVEELRGVLCVPGKIVSKRALRGAAEVVEVCWGGEDGAAAGGEGGARGRRAGRGREGEW